MNELDNKSDQIQKYLAGQMPADERLRFENELKSNEGLKSEVEELRSLLLGIFVEDELSVGHLDSEQILRYAIESAKIDKTLRGEIENHLAKCPDCREEVELCQETLKMNLVGMPVEEKSFLKRIYEFLFTPRVAWRPIYGVAILILLMLPSYMMIQHYSGVPAEISRFRIAEPGVRGLTNENLIVLNNKEKLVRLEFVVPIIKNRLYSFELCDSMQKIIFALPYNKAQEIFAIEVPTSYLGQGDYTLVVKEYAGNLKQQGQFSFPLRIALSN
jgi:hypothetical protein